MLRHYIGFKTIVFKEVFRFMRMWGQTLLPSAITMSLYFIIFGNLIGSQIHPIEGLSYMQYLAPGLIMMSVINNSYANVVGSFYGSRFGKNIEELLVSPLPNSLILLGYVVGGTLRGLFVGLIVTVLSLFFTHLHVYNIAVTITIVLLTAMLFSLAGFLNGIYARNFDDIAIVPTFILTPLTYLGGVFYSVHSLPVGIWKTISMFNPILYMVNAFRGGLLGVSDVPVNYALLMVCALVIILFTVCLHLLNRGVGIRT